MISVLAWMISWAIHRRGPGIALALHSSATLVGLLHASLAASRAPQAVPVAGLLLHMLATPSYHRVIKGRRGRAKF